MADIVNGKLSGSRKSYGTMQRPKQTAAEQVAPNFDKSFCAVDCFVLFALLLFALLFAGWSRWGINASLSGAT